MSPANESPAGPEPTTAIFLPFFSAMTGVAASPLSRSKSAANRSRYPIATGAFFILLYIQRDSHCFS